MLDLFRAEWMKIGGNRIVATAFIWIYPAAALMLLVFAMIAAAVSEPFRQQVLTSPPQWTQQVMFPWIIINSELGRMMLVAFAGDVFGGEYQRQMWKNLLPRRRRHQLILNKFLTIAAYALFAFVLMCLIVGVFSGFVTMIAGASYGPNPAQMSGEEWSVFIRQFGSQASIAFAAALLAACYAALGGIFTRSILGAIVFGVLFTLAEQGIVIVLLIVSQITQTPDLLQVYLLTPGYNLANLSSWGAFGGGYVPPFLTNIEMSVFSVETSTLLVLGWIAGLIGLTVYLFRRQDIMA